MFSNTKTSEVQKNGTLSSPGDTHGLLTCSAHDKHGQSPTIRTAATPAHFYWSHRFLFFLICQMKLILDYIISQQQYFTRGRQTFRKCSPVELTSAVAGFLPAHKERWLVGSLQHQCRHHPRSLLTTPHTPLFWQWDPRSTVNHNFLFF